ncbi:MAG: hypothetical protein HYZ29_25960 [Myxococcales bacterium]|nr:hypothetical protein [Myxococcales bacterium]
MDATQLFCYYFARMLSAAEMGPLLRRAANDTAEISRRALAAEKRLCPERDLGGALIRAAEAEMARRRAAAKAAAQDPRFWDWRQVGLAYRLDRTGFLPLAIPCEGQK